MNFNSGYTLLFFALLASLFFSCAEEEEEGIVLDDSFPIMTFHNVNALLSQNTATRVLVKAPLQYQYQNKDESYPDGVYLEYYDSLGVITTTLVADSGYHKTDDNSYRVRGNVVVINVQEDRKLETEILNWDMKKEEIFTDTLTAVKITTPQEIIKGNGLKAKQDLSVYDITGGVTGVFTVKD